MYAAPRPITQQRCQLNCVRVDSVGPAQASVCEQLPSCTHWIVHVLAADNTPPCQSPVCGL